MRGCAQGGPSGRGPRKGSRERGFADGGRPSPSSALGLLGCWRWQTRPITRSADPSTGHLAGLPRSRPAIIPCCAALREREHVSASSATLDEHLPSWEEGVREQETVTYTRMYIERESGCSRYSPALALRRRGLSQPPRPSDTQLLLSASWDVLRHLGRTQPTAFFFPAL
jgi:hypothetical protein